MAPMPPGVFAAILIDDDGQLTAAELAGALSVSPAAIAGAVRYLTHLGLVAGGRERGARRDHSQTPRGGWSGGAGRRHAMLAPWEQALEDGIKPAGGLAPPA